MHKGAENTNMACALWLSRTKPLQSPFDIEDYQSNVIILSDGFPTVTIKITEESLVTGNLSTWPSCLKLTPGLRTQWPYKWYSRVNRCWWASEICCCLRHGGFQLCTFYVKVTSITFNYMYVYAEPMREGWEGYHAPDTVSTPDSMYLYNGESDWLRMWLVGVLSLLLLIYTSNSRIFNKTNLF